MSVFKPFTTEDVIVSPFEVNKTFTFSGDTELTSNQIDRYIGKNITQSFWVSGEYPTGYVTTQDQILVYHSIKELYYSNYLLDENGSPVATASFNLDGTVTGESYTPNYDNYLSTTLPPSRYFPTGSNEAIGVISIPSNLFGEYIKPTTLTLQQGDVILQDDGNGNVLYDDLKVGDVIYEHGIVILTNKGTEGQTGYGFVTYGNTTYGATDYNFITEFITGSNITCSFESTLTLYETQYKCTIRQNEFNFSQNPTLISGSTNSGQMVDFVTGSYFSPYVTTVGLYNNAKELIAIGKLAQPLPISTVTDTHILVNMDMY